jgi:2-dehydropantoate 2-reductase
MKACIVGAGAIGSFIGVRLGRLEGVQLSALARGTTLSALRIEGMRLDLGGETLRVACEASDSAAALGPQDLVVIALKAPALPALAASLAPLIGPQTIVLPAMNGIPWWFGQGLAALGSEPLQSVDPGGVVSAQLNGERVIGCVVHASVGMLAPGHAQHRMGHGLIIGEPQGGGSARVESLGALLARAGFEVTCSERIRYDIWYKLWGNMTMNPVSALTGATIDRLLADELVREFCSEAMREAAEIGQHIGCSVSQSPDDRHAVTRKLGAFKTSMLQDVESGRPMELDALLGAVREIAGRVHLATPNIDALFGLTRLMGRVKGLYPAG